MKTSNSLNLLPVLLFLSSLFYPFNIALAFGNFDLGGIYNPLNIQIQPNQTQSNIETSRFLQTQYGSSLYNSCRAIVCSNTGGDPSREAQCLNTVAYHLSLGIMPSCRAIRPVACDKGYTMINGSCVSDAPTQQPPDIDLRPAIQSAIQNMIDAAKRYEQSCKQKYGDASKSNNKILASGDIECGCITGYEWNAGKTTCVQIPPPKTNDQICKEHYGTGGGWTNQTNNKGEIICDCSIGYQWNSTRTACDATGSIEMDTILYQAAPIRSTLRLGSAGKEVQILQSLLKTLGHFNGETTEYYGVKTRNAVAAFQGANNLDQTGAVGPKTRVLLNSAFQATR